MTDYTSRQAAKDYAATLDAPALTAFIAGIADGETHTVIDTFKGSPVRWMLSGYASGSAAWEPFKKRDSEHEPGAWISEGETITPGINTGIYTNPNTDTGTATIGGVTYKGALVLLADGTDKNEQTNVFVGQWYALISGHINGIPDALVIIKDNAAFFMWDESRGTHILRIATGSLLEESDMYGVRTSVTLLALNEWLGSEVISVQEMQYLYFGADNVRSYLEQDFVPASDGTTPVTFSSDVINAYEYELTQYVWFKDGFDWGASGDIDTIGGKIGWGLVGGSKPSGGTSDVDGFSFRFMWRGIDATTARLEGYAYSADRVQRFPHGDSYLLTAHTIQTGVWIKLKMRVKMNTSHAASDGTCIIEKDDVEVFRKEDIRWWNGGDEPVVEALYYSSFHGGGNTDWSPASTVVARISKPEYTPIYAAVSTGLLNISDPEDTTTNGWIISDDDPTGASIVNVDDNGNRVIRLSGDGLNNTYQIGELERYNGFNHYDNDISIRFKSIENFRIDVYADTIQGLRRFVYLRFGTGYSVLEEEELKFGIGTATTTNTGAFFDLDRDLVADLATHEPTNTLLAINGITFRGDMDIDHIKLGA